jgi:hypothetical protein
MFVVCQPRLAGTEAQASLIDRRDVSKLYELAYLSQGVPHGSTPTAAIR